MEPAASGPAAGGVGQVSSRVWMSWNSLCSAQDAQNGPGVLLVQAVAFSVCISICSAQLNPLKFPPGRSEAVFLGSAWKALVKMGKSSMITLVNFLFQFGFSSRIFSQTESNLSCLSFLLLWRTSSLFQTHRSVQTRLLPAQSVCHVVCWFEGSLSHRPS